MHCFNTRKIKRVLDRVTEYIYKLRRKKQSKPELGRTSSHIGYNNSLHLKRKIPSHAKCKCEQNKKTRAKQRKEKKKKERSKNKT